MSDSNHPADQLALVRDRIKRLQAEEETLKAACKELPEGDRVGRFYEVRVTETERTTFDGKAAKELLKAAGHDVSALEKKSSSVTVTLRALND